MAADILSCPQCHASFESDGKFADQKPHRYQAACAAVLAASGRGKDADKLDDKTKSALRGQGLAWLRAELAAWSTTLKNNPKAIPSAQAQMKAWQSDPELAAIREPSLTSLPAAEQTSWRQFWAEVARFQPLETENKHVPGSVP